MVGVFLWGWVSVAQAEPVKPRWEKDIAIMTEQGRANPSPDGVILFTGSSSIRRWITLVHDFPNHAVLNRGFGELQISDLIWIFLETVWRSETSPSCDLFRNRRFE